MRLALVFATAILALADARGDGIPRREDFGSVVSLHLYGSYEEMARQQAQLLGPLLREVYEFNRADYERSLARSGLGTRLGESLLIPLASGFNDEKSGFDDTIEGIAEVLGVEPREVLRASFALDAASTVFAASGSATADGRALIGRNVDWGDAGGRRRPVVLHLHPRGGDLAHVAVAWPLMHLPTVGVNEAGFAISLNYFDTEPLVTLIDPVWPQRRALQTARTVEEGIRIFHRSRRLGAANFVAMADASGAIALLECRPGSGCTVLRPEQPWLAHANHARTPAMVPFDRYRSPDSFARQQGMERAVERNLGAITPERAAEILRDRTGHRFPNATSVGNLFVLNAVVVQPAKARLWHSTEQQPFAPFGEYVAFSARDDASPAASLPAAPALGGEGFARDRDAIARARRALDAQRSGDPARLPEARALWDEIAAQDPPALDPARVALARAHALHALGKDAAAYDALAPAQDPGAPFEARARGLAMRGLLADMLGRREDALRHWRETLAHLDAGPHFNVFGALRDLATAGLVAPQRGPELPIEWWDVGVPR